MCHLRKIALRDYQESVTTRQKDIQTDAGQSDPDVPLCFAADTIKHKPVFLYGSTKSMCI